MAGRANLSRSFIGMALVVPLAVVLGACNVWTMFGYDATHSGDSPETAIGASNVGSLVLGGTTVPVGGPIVSSPTTWNDTVFVTANTASGGMLYAYSADGSQNCSAPGPQSCTPLWSDEVGGSQHGLRSSPAVDPQEGVVYVAATDGLVYAYNAANGNLLWTSPTLGGSIDSSATIADNNLYVPEGYGWIYVFPLTNGSDNKNPSCQNRRGDLVCWPQYGYRTPGDIASSPAVADVMVNGVATQMLYTTAGPNVDGLGRWFWAFEATYDSVKCSGTQYQIGSGGATCATPLWGANYGDRDTTPAVDTADGMTYIGTDNDGLLAFSADGSAGCTGSPYGGTTTQTQYTGMVCDPVWVGNTGRAGGSELGSSPGASPVIDTTNNIVYQGSRTGTLYAFDASKGTQLWTAATGGTIDSPAAVANGVVYVGCSNAISGQVCNGNLFALSAATGLELWSGATGSSIDNSPIVADENPSNNVGAVYVGSGDQVFAFKTP